MKQTSFAIFAILACTALLRSETEQPAPTAAVLLNRIPDGTPAPEPAPLPEYQIRPTDVLTSRSVEQDGRTITLREIKPIALPAPPEKNPTTPSHLDPVGLAGRLAEFGARRPTVQILNLSARVYRSTENPPCSLVTCWPAGANSPFTFWSSADFSLIAGGIQSFGDTNGQIHHLFMSWGNVDEARERASAIRRGITYQAPATPEFPTGPATFQVIGNPPVAELLIPIQSLHDLYHQNQAELLTAYQGREQARLQKEEQLRLHPPQPQNITLNYWRTEKPASAKDGGAR